MEAHQHTAQRSEQHAIFLVRDQKVANYHGKGNSTLSRNLRPGAALLNLRYRRLCSGSKGNMRLDVAVYAGGHMMHEQDACDLVLSL